MNKNRRKIICYLLLIFLITRPYFFYRHFYIVRGVPITLWDKKIIIGEWYWKFSEPTKNYLEFPSFDSMCITFLDKTHFVVGDFFARDSAQVVHNLDGYTCVEYFTKSCRAPWFKELNEKYPIEESLVNYYFDWAVGRFYPKMCYYKNGKIYTLDGVRFGYWVFSKEDLSLEDSN